ncbi:MAG: hypothetical protein ABI811_19265 [Acidobacteriota bacterium]
MNGFLVDTNCISEDTRPKPNDGVVAWLKETDPSLLYLSVLTLGEIRKGIAGRPVIDGLLAATAIEHNLTIVSRNARDFAITRVPVFNPWT